MSEWSAKERIKHQETLDPQFGDEIANAPGGEAIFSCIQCGTCSGTCPLSHSMDYTPRRIIAMTRAGFKDEVLRSNTIWICASCYSCSVECPRNIKVTDVMYALKQRALRAKIYPRRFPIAVLAREFFQLVRMFGRNTESLLVTALFLKTNPLNLVKQSVLGVKLLLKGRMPIIPLPERIKKREDLQKILNAVERQEKVDGWHPVE